MIRRINVLIIIVVLGLSLSAGSVPAQQSANSTAYSGPALKQKAQIKPMMKSMKKKGKKGFRCMMKGREQMPGPMGCKGMMGRFLMQRMSDEQRAKFLNDTVDLRRQMVVKRFDYREALRNPEITPKDLAKIEKDMLKLRIKMLDRLITSGSN